MVFPSPLPCPFSCFRVILFIFSLPQTPCLILRNACVCFLCVSLQGKLLIWQSGGVSRELLELFLRRGQHSEITEVSRPEQANLLLIQGRVKARKERRNLNESKTSHDDRQQQQQQLQQDTELTEEDFQILHAYPDTPAVSLQALLRQLLQQKPLRETLEHLTSLFQGFIGCSTGIEDPEVRSNVERIFQVLGG